MKLNVFSLSLAVAVVAAISAPASAADWNYGAGSIKDSGPAAVPVPAPVPVPEYAARYYFRADVGAGLGDAPDISESGYYYGADAATGPYSIQPSWFNTDFDTFVTLGVGVGMNIGNNWRADFTAETRSQGDTRFGVRNTYYTEVDRSNNYDDVRVVVGDKTSLTGGIFLLNGYYDFNRGPQSRFTPYVGGGVGFAWNELRRVHHTTESRRTCDTTTRCQAARTVSDTAQLSEKKSDVSVAAMATVGLGYRLNDYALLDFNYRYLFVDSTEARFRISGNQFGGSSNVSIGPTHEHQLRAGIRFEVN